MMFRLSDIATATGGSLVGNDKSVDGVSIDSRTVRAGNLFVAIVAERDGHEFIDAAVKAGAGAVVASRSIDIDVPHVVVAETTVALAAVARPARARLSDLVVGVTGSVGKTSTKDLIAAAVGSELRTHASYRSFNNELGVPLTLLNAPEDAEAIIVEMGARGSGHIRDLCEYVQPTIGVVTRVGAAHTELFGSIDAVAAAKAELIESLPATGVAVLNASDQRVLAMAERTEASVLTFGAESADVVGTDVVLDSELRPRFAARTPWGDVAVELAAAGYANVENALAAIAVGGAVGVGVDAMAEGLACADVSPWRMEVSRTSGGALLINDAYNANPMSVEAALRSLAQVEATRRVAVLGLMAELGDEHDEGHRAMSELAASLDIELLAFREPAYGRTTLDTHDEVVASLGELTADDAVLVKGSRVAELEELAARF